MREIKLDFNHRNGYQFKECFLIVIALAVFYWLAWPALDAPYLLDDMINLRPLFQLLEYPERIWQELFANSSGPLGRPVSILSFSVEYLVYLPQQVDRLRFNNLSIHALNFLLACFIALRLPGKFPSWLLISAMILWLLLPINTAAVFYIIQRMSLLAGTFVLAAILCYVILRTTSCKGFRYLSFFLIVLFAILAVLSKENGILALPLILLVEYCFWGFEGYSRRLKVVALVLVSAFVLSGMFLFVIYGFSENSDRGFSGWQRLLVQAIVLLEYLKDIFIPHFSLMIYQDGKQVSDYMEKTGLLVFSWVFWLTLIIVSIRWVGGQSSTKYLGFGILWFLLAHSVESTFLPLELVFLHRNYIPTIGLFLGFFMYFYVVTIDYIDHRSQAIIIGAYSLYFVIVLGVLSAVWSNATVFAMNAYMSNPESERAKFEWAKKLAESGRPDLSMDILLDSELDKENVSLDAYFRTFALYCYSGQKIPRRFYKKFSSELHQLSNNMHRNVTTDLKVLVDSYLNRDYCKAQDRHRFSNLMFDALTDSEFEVSRGILKSMMSFEFQFENAERAELYAQALREKDKKDVDALLVLGLIYKAEERSEFNEIKIALGNLEGEMLADQKQIYNFLNSESSSE